MKRTTLLFLLIAALSSTSLASRFDWITFTSKRGGFSVLMPGPAEPEDKVQTVETSKVGPYTSHLFVQRGGHTLYLVGWTDYAPGVNINRKAEMEANRDNFLKGLKATVKTSSWITFRQESALEFTGDLNGRVIRSRVYMVGPRPYMTIAITDAGADDFSQVTRFLDSFRLSGK